MNTRNLLEKVLKLSCVVCVAYVVAAPSQASAGCAQFVEVKISARGGTTLSIKNATLKWGKFYQEGNKDTEIKADEINTITIPSGETRTISACGRESASSGTEGTFDIYDGTTKVGTYSWDCPYISKTNTSTWQSTSDKYIVQCTGGSLDSGALGSILIKVVKTD